jgi:aminoglycoside/choline kinase family phosphotransferase
LQQVALVHELPRDHIPEGLRSQLQPPFDDALYAWEQDYFFTQFAARFSAMGSDELEQVRRRKDFSGLCGTLASLPRTLVHRDFQSQNVIIRDGGAWMIDYQGLREGRPEYDLASLLFDPYAALTADERTELRDYYFSLRSDAVCDGEVLAMCACQRLMQALGAYGKLGAGDGKTAFLKHIGPAVENLRGVLQESGLLPGLDAVLTLRPGALPPPFA